MEQNPKTSTKEELAESGIFYFEDLTGQEIEEKTDLRQRECSSCKNKVPSSCSICYICEHEDNI